MSCNNILLLGFVVGALQLNTGKWNIFLMCKHRTARMPVTISNTMGPFKCWQILHNAILFSCDNDSAFLHPHQVYGFVMKSRQVRACISSNYQQQKTFRQNLGKRHDDMHRTCDEDLMKMQRRFCACLFMNICCSSFHRLYTIWQLREKLSEAYL
jgi:hypothetical protein